MQDLSSILARIVFCGAVLSFVSCKTMNDQSTVKEFTKIPKANEEDPEVVDFKLSRVPNIKATVTRYLPRLSREDRDDDQVVYEDMYYYKIEFGKLSQDDFALLKKTYFDDPKVTYSADRLYELTDFMPPQIQALNETRFKAETIPTGISVDPNPAQKTPPAQYQFTTTSNCWNAVYEINRGSRTETEIFYIDGTDISTFLFDDQYSTQINAYDIPEESWKTPEAKVQRNQGLRPFDTILFSSKASGLQHAATFIDDDLYFERTSPKDTVNYRFVLFEDIATAYTDGEGHFSDFTAVVRRFGKKAIPKVSTLLSFKALGKKLPNGFINEAFAKAYPDVLDYTTNCLPCAAELGEYHDIWVIGVASLGHDDKKQRYTLSKDAFKHTVQARVDQKQN